MARISVAELAELMDDGAEPVVLDVRSLESRERTGFIPNSRPVQQEDIDQELSGLKRDVEIIVYCNCPNEVSAARIAKMLMMQGFVHVRPLEGGLDAWIAGGHSTAS
jgi:rhodanese-related sulfurtransferase